jgi:hypothetical protein
MNVGLPAGSGKEGSLQPSLNGPLQAVCERPVQMLAAEASEQRLDGQVF